MDYRHVPYIQPSTSQIWGMRIWSQVSLLYVNSRYAFLQNNKTQWLLLNTNTYLVNSKYVQETQISVFFLQLGVGFK